MKYWRGYITAIIFAALGWGFVQFASAHPVMVDVVYPYLSRIYMNSVATWSAGTSICLWQLLLFFGIVVIIATAVLMVVLKWNPVQWFGWVLAVVFGFNTLSTVVYGLNAYASPLADDIRLTISDYTVSELNEATLFFRDQANTLATQIPRDGKGNANLGKFEDIAKLAHNGFETLTYEKYISVFASVEAPVKKLTMPGLFLSKGDSGMVVPLTGEAAVSPKVPSACLPFAMCKELAHRISIYAEADGNFAAFLACISNSDPSYQYSGYMMAYYHCQRALKSIPTSTAQTCAKNADGGVNDYLRKDLAACHGFYGEAQSTANVQPTANITASDSEITLISFSSYSDVVDLFASWYIQEYLLPVYEEENKTQEFDPFDETQVDLIGPTEDEEKEETQ